MTENNHNNHPPQLLPEKSSKSVWWLIIGTTCMILDVWLGHITMDIPYVSKNSGTLFFVGLGFIIYYLK